MLQVDRRTGAGRRQILPPVTSSYAAIYYPWVRVLDPRTNDTRLVPPGGHVAGIYARTDIERGVHKAPANDDRARHRHARPAGRPQAAGVPGQQARSRTSSTRGASTSSATSAPTAAASGSGARARSPTTRSGSTSTSAGCSSSSRSRSTRHPVGGLRAERRADLGRGPAQHLQLPDSVWRSGALMGTQPEEAFFVRCDRTTMTQDDIDNGRLICYIGIAAGEAGRVRDLPHQPEDRRRRA